VTPGILKSNNKLIAIVFLNVSFKHIVQLLW